MKTVIFEYGKIESLKHLYLFLAWFCKFKMIKQDFFSACLYLKHVFSEVTSGEGVGLKLKLFVLGLPSNHPFWLAKSRLSKNRFDTVFSGISSAKDVVMKKLPIIQSPNWGFIMCEVQWKNEEKMSIFLLFISYLILQLKNRHLDITVDGRGKISEPNAAGA